MRSSAMLLLAPLMFTHSYAQAQIPEDQNAGCDSSNMASTYVPIESWIYPAIERLALAGYVQTAFAGLRPWTRMEIARLVAEAQEQQADLDPEEVPDEQMNLLRDLAREFRAELRQRDGECNHQAAIDSIDWRSTAIAGTPLTDGYHFAQTLTNDYGRPYGQGANIYTGISGHAASGPFAAYLRVELQRTVPGPMTRGSGLYSDRGSRAGLRLRPRTGAGRLRLLHISRQPVLVWKASVVVGAGQRRATPVQQQC
jgi:hypothetical protein